MANFFQSIGNELGRVWNRTTGSADIAHGRPGNTPEEQAIIDRINAQNHANKRKGIRNFGVAAGGMAGGAALAGLGGGGTAATAATPLTGGAAPGAAAAAGGLPPWLKTAMGISDIALPIAGGIAGGIAQGQSDKRNERMEQARLAEQKRQFDARYGMDADNNAIGLQRGLDSAPMRDRAMAMLTARMESPPTPYQPRDAFNPQDTPMGSASDPHGVGAVQRNAAANYTPGAGGVDTSVIEQVLNDWRKKKQGMV